MKAGEMVARLEGIAHRVDAANVEPALLSVDGQVVTVQCVSADEVDAVVELLEDFEPLWPAGLVYSRWGSFDEVVPVHVFGPLRTGSKCSCGRACNHREGGASS